MRSDWRVTGFLSGVLAVTLAYSVATLYSQDKQAPGSPRQKVGPSSQEELNDFRSQFPTADYNASEPADREKHLQRATKNRRHNNSGLVSREPSFSVGETALLAEGALNIPALPISNSNVIVSGTVRDAQAYLSEDKTNVYSEFTFLVEEVLKNDGSVPVEPNKTTSVERVGGFVRYPNGKKELYRLVGFGMPRTGRRYVLFLTVVAHSQDLRILTGYELRADGVRPLDEARQFDAYRGYDENAFLDALREALQRPAQTPADNQEPRQ